jgi:hypothetical protein
MTDNKRIPLSGYYRVGLTNTTLFPQASGEKQIVGLQKTLPNDIAQQLQLGDVYAFINCPGEKNAEAVYVEKGSYSSTNRLVTIRRGASKFALGDNSNATGDFTVPKNLFLDFGYTNPQDLKYLVEAVDDFFGAGAEFFNERLPKANRTTAGTVKVAYRPQGIADTDASAVISTDAPAWQQLSKAVFGESSAATDTLLTDTATMSRARYLQQVLNLFDNQQKIDSFEFLLKTFANAANRKKLKDFLEAE